MEGQRRPTETVLIQKGPHHETVYNTDGHVSGADCSRAACSLRLCMADYDRRNGHSRLGQRHRGCRRGPAGYDALEGIVRLAPAACGGADRAENVAKSAPWPNTA